MELRYDPVVVFYLGDGDNVLLVEMVICRSTIRFDKGTAAVSPCYPYKILVSFHQLMWKI